MAKIIERNAVAVGGDGHRTFLTTLPMGELKRFTKVDLYKPDLPIDHPDQGYQREAEPRYKGFGKYLIRNDANVVLTPLVLSARDAKLEFDPKRSFLKISDARPLWVVDGQHRIEGAHYAIYSKHAESLSDVPWPVEIVEGMTKVEEMKRFVDINGNAKSVRTDLVNMILSQRARKEGEDAIEERELWKVVVTRAVDLINDSEPWKGRIAMPNEHAPKKREIAENEALANERLVRATSVMTSLKPIYTYGSEATGEFAGTLQQQGQALADVILDYWRAIEHISPQLFQNPKEYVIQKTPGVFSLHGLLLYLMRAMYKARRPWVKDEFLVMLNGSDATFSPKFWSKEEGDAQKYGSMKGFSQLTKNLIKSLEGDEED